MCGGPLRGFEGAADTLSRSFTLGRGPDGPRTPGRRVGFPLGWLGASRKYFLNGSAETDFLGPRHFNDAVDRRSYGDPANRTRDILSCDGLDQNGCESHRVAVRRIVGYSLDELEELRSVDDRVLDRRSPDQVLLGDLGTEVATFGEAFGSHDRQRDVMTHTCRRFSIKEVAGRCFEELQHCRVLERWGVRHVYDHSGTGEGFGQTLRGEHVEDCGWGRAHRLGAVLKKLADALG